MAWSTVRSETGFNDEILVANVSAAPPRWIER